MLYRCSTLKKNSTLLHLGLPHSLNCPHSWNKTETNKTVLRQLLRLFCFSFVSVLFQLCRQLYTPAGRPKAPLGAAKCVMEILGGGNKEDRKTKVKMCWCLCLKCSKTHLQATIISKFSRGDTPNLIKKGEDRKGRGEKKIGMGDVASWP